VGRRVLYLEQTPPLSTGGGRGPRRDAVDGLGAAGLVAVGGRHTVGSGGWADEARGECRCEGVVGGGACKCRLGEGVSGVGVARDEVEGLHGAVGQRVA